MALIFGECDSCGADNRVLHRAELAGLEAYACAECRNADPKEDAWEIEEEIKSLEADEKRLGATTLSTARLVDLRNELARITAESKP